MPWCGAQIWGALIWTLLPVTPLSAHIPGHHVLGAPEELRPSSTLDSRCSPYVDPPTFPGESSLVMPCQQVPQGAWGPKRTIPRTPLSWVTESLGMSVGLCRGL